MTAGRWLFDESDKIFWTKLSCTRIMDGIENIPVRRNVAEADGRKSRRKP